MVHQLHRIVKHTTGESLHAIVRKIFPMIQKIPQHQIKIA